MMLELILEDGSKWGDIAVDVQLEDAAAVLTDEERTLHFITRPRGGSKSTDTAGIGLAWLAAEAPERARGAIIASNATQASIVVDAAAGMINATDELRDVIKAENERLVNLETGAWIRVVPMSDAGAWGLRNHFFLILDEFAQWPDTRGARRVWTAARSTVQKVPGCRLIILTSAGEPSHWSYAIFNTAKQTPAMWRVSEMPGPVPWQRPRDIEALRRELLPSEFDRLVLNIWSEAEDRAISPEDYDAAAGEGVPNGVAPAGTTGGGMRLRWPAEHVRYVVTVDVGTRHDATVMCVAHKEGAGTSNVMVVDHLERWQGSRHHHVTLDKVRDRVLDLAIEYNGATVYADPDQFIGSIQGLNKRGVKAQEWRFTATSVGQVATALVQAFRNHAIALPHGETLRKELLQVRLRESAPGVTRLDHARGGHDDQAVTLGMACHLLLGTRPGYGSAKAFFEATKAADELIEERRARRREEQGTRALARHLRRLSRPDDSQERRQRACTHRWRGEHCAWGCGATRPS